MSNQESQTVIVSPPGQRWTPASGDATEALGKLLVEERKELPDQATFAGIVSSSLEIISDCKPFDATPGRKTGLVIGYVQSGKTMSMATVASLARDNGCRIVILLAGVTEILLQQTARKRFRPYLLNQPDARSGWQVRDSVDSAEIPDLRHDLTGWVKEWKRDTVAEERKRPLFIAVMKNHVHLEKLHDALKNVDLRGIPALILDDEADQASLDNNAAKNTSETSTTYSRIEAVRDALPNHTYLQYTATPQAPLLISLADMLSPDFAQILTPGKGYTGGRAFFVEHRSLVRDVKDEDLFDPKTPPTAPPESLLQAMREFFIGVAAAYAGKQSGKRSMLIHPSQNRVDHDAFFSFAQRNKSSWQDELHSDDESIRAGIVPEFRSAYDDLVKTEPSLPPFETILKELPFAIADTRLWKVNSDDGREVDWDASYSHLLVGGDKLNRGFTVEGLSVTYMPRRPGSWNADTIQQRARFFGYKQKYLGLCRVYLHPDVKDAFTAYVEHEEDLRGQLKEFARRPLKEWKRTFLMDHRLNPTRPSVLAESIEKPKVGGWFRQRWPHAGEKMVERNRETLATFLKAVHDSGTKFKTLTGQHTAADVPLQLVINSLFVEWGTSNGDAINWPGVLIWALELRRQQPAATCQIVRIKDGAVRERAEDKDSPGRIGQLFEGRRDKSGDKGDEVLRDKNRLTIQVHTLDVKLPTNAKVAAVPALAVHFPDNFAKDIVIQTKAGHAE